MNGYTGRRYDSETDLYYYRARWYAAELGRFLQTDPIGYEDQMNLYSYVANDPVNNTDPTGMVIDSFLVVRELSSGIGGGHAFIVTHAKSVGDPNAKVFSYGPVGDKLGRQAAGSEMLTTDTKDWESGAESLKGNIIKIDAPDDIVSGVAEAVIGNDDYDLVPSGDWKQDSANSNSAAFAVANKSLKIAGSSQSKTAIYYPYFHLKPQYLAIYLN